MFQTDKHPAHIEGLKDFIDNKGEKDVGLGIQLSMMVDTAHMAALLDVAEAARAFSDAVAACYPAIESAAVFMHVHGQNYTGPTFGAEHDALRAALARLGEGK